MTIKKEVNLWEFEFWAGAKQLTDYLTVDELDIIEQELVAIYEPCSLDETDINDLFWFESDFICQIIGYNNYENFYNKVIKNL